VWQRASHQQRCKWSSARPSRRGASRQLPFKSNGGQARHHLGLAAVTHYRQRPHPACNQRQRPQEALQAAFLPQPEANHLLRRKTPQRALRGHLEAFREVGARPAPAQRAHRPAWRAWRRLGGHPGGRRPARRAARAEQRQPARVRGCSLARANCGRRRCWRVARSALAQSVHPGRAVLQYEAMQL
jgi:hypothetical protein